MEDLHVMVGMFSMKALTPNSRDNVNDIPFLDYFPYAVSASSPYFEDPSSRAKRFQSLYHAHTIADQLLFLGLDSGIVNTHNGKQAEFIEVRTIKRLCCATSGLLKCVNSNFL